MTRRACLSWNNPDEPGLSIRFDTQEKERIVFREGDPKRMERKLNQSAQIAAQARTNTTSNTSTKASVSIVENV